MSISFFETVISPQAIDLAVSALRSERVSQGHRVAEFEDVLSRGVPVQPSGRAEQRNIGAAPGAGTGRRESRRRGGVAGTDLRCDGAVVLMQQATPVFADIDPLTGNMSSASLDAVVSDRTKAILAVHWGGYPCDLDALGRVAARHKIVLIEDAAHALGASYRGRAVGSLSRFTAFSFQAIKHVTCGDGGVLCCTEPADADAARRRRWFGLDREQPPSALGDRDCDIDAVGYKYHMNDLAAAVGLGTSRISVSDWRAGGGLRARIAGRSRACGGDTAPFRGWPRKRQLAVHRAGGAAGVVRRALKGRGIPTSVVDRGIDRYQVFGGTRATLIGQRDFDERQISLPLHSSLSEKDVQQVIAGVRAGW